MAAVEAYCVKCREKREMKDPEEVTMKNGRPAMQGACPVCGTKLFRMMSTKAAGDETKTAEKKAAPKKSEKPAEKAAAKAPAKKKA